MARIKFLKDVDRIVKSRVKDILSLTDGTPDAYLYAPRKFKRLGIMAAKTGFAIYQHLLCADLTQKPVFDGEQRPRGNNFVCVEIDKPHRQDPRTVSRNNGSA